MKEPPSLSTKEQQLSASAMKINSAALGSEIELVGNLKPQLAEQTVSLKIIKPDGSVPTPTNIQTGELLH